MDCSELSHSVTSSTASTSTTKLSSSSRTEYKKDAASAAEVDDVPIKQEAFVKTKKQLSFHMSFLALNIMVLLVSLDATALSVAIPIIAHDLAGTTLQAFWASLSFLIVTVVCQPIYTSLSEVFGRKGPLYSTFVWFVAGSIIFATAQNMSMLILGRVLQGVGAGGLDVLSEIILVDMTSLKERPLYLGLFAIPLAAGATLGPIVGALFCQYAAYGGWRWLGWINLPISILNLALIMRFMRLKPLKNTFREKLRRLDWVGMALFGIGATAFASPMSWAGMMHPWKSWQTLLPLLVGLAVLVIFGLYDMGAFGGPPTEPIFPTRIFKDSTASLTLANSFCHGAVIYVGIFYMPLMFQAVFLETPFRSAVSMLPLCCTSVGFGIITGLAVETSRKYRWGIIVSWTITATACGLITLWQPSSSLALKASIQVLLGVGTGPFFVLLLLPIQASVVNVDDAGIAAGILVSFRLFGALVSLAMCSTLFSTVFANHISSLGPLPESVAILSDVSEAIGFIPELRLVEISPIMKTGINDAYRRAIVAVFLMLAGFAALGFFMSFFIREIPIDNGELGRQQIIEEKRDESNNC